jgi:hypothetical protein
VVGDGGQADHQGALRQVRQQGVGGRLRATAQRQDSAMDREADDGVHHRLRGGVDRRRDPGEQSGQGLRSFFGDQYRDDRVPAGGGELFQNHLALGDEQAFAADEVALAHGAVAGDAGIIRVFDQDHGHGLAGFDPCGRFHWTTRLQLSNDPARPRGGRLK